MISQRLFSYMNESLPSILQIRRNLADLESWKILASFHLFGECCLSFSFQCPQLVQ